MSSGERPRRLTRAEAKARTRSLLLEAAARVFARKGFGGSSVDEIAEEAGFTTGALYSNFASKEQLILELLTERGASRLTSATGIVSDGATTLDALRDKLNRLLTEVADDDADLAPLQAEIWLYAIRRPAVLAELADTFRGNRDALSDVLETRATRRRQSADADFEQVATVLLALFQGLVQLRRTDPDLVPDQLYGTAASWIFAGLSRYRPATQQSPPSSTI